MRDFECGMSFYLHFAAFRGAKFGDFRFVCSYSVYCVAPAGGNHAPKPCDGTNIDEQDEQDNSGKEGKKSCESCASMFYSLIPHVVTRISSQFAQRKLIFPGKVAIERAGRRCPRLPCLGLCSVSPPARGRDCLVQSR